MQYIDWNRCLVMGTSEDYVRHLRTYYLRDREDVDWAALTGDVDAFAQLVPGQDGRRRSRPRTSSTAPSPSDESTVFAR